MTNATNYTKTIAMNSTLSGEQTEDHILAVVLAAFPDITADEFNAAIDELLDSGKLEPTTFWSDAPVRSHLTGRLVQLVPALRRAA